ncbi:MAG: formate dehydrogenase accessory sulfurtransferase FdhD [Flavobacteriales bacterium]|jgi:FdhD protein|nr:formate dehydrogenase accessory sulfurtransferase FdhD [Flavobacteriales bacterium]
MKASLNYQALKNGQPVSDALVVEVPVQLFIEEEPLTVSMCTPTHVREWAYGILFTEGIIRSADQVLSYSEEEVDHQIILRVTLNNATQAITNKRSLLSVSACGICGKTAFEPATRSDDERSSMTPSDDERSSMTLRDDRGADDEQSSMTLRENIAQMMVQLRDSQTLFDETGGCHAAGVFNREGQLIFASEDIGRHNAVDKVIGHLLLNNQLRSAKFIVVSGRVSYEIVAKCFAAGIPNLAAVSSPSSLAVDYAKELGLSLFAFCRENRVTQYA